VCDCNTPDGSLLLCEQPEVHAEVAQLRLQVQHLQQLLDHADEAVWVGLTRGDMQARNALASQWWAQASPSDQQALIAWVNALPQAKGECTLFWTEGGRKVLSARCEPLADGLHRVYLRDITRAHDIDRMKSDFLSAAAHELRTPLASIYGFAELMLVRSMAPDKQKELVGTIHRQAHSLIELINELLDLSRIEAQQGKDLNIVPCALAPLVDGVVQGLHHKAEHHPLIQELRHGACTVLADADKTRQALLNVLSNAVKYSPQGGRITIRTVLRGVGGQQQVGVQVCDEGMGMNEGQCRRAFERCYRAHPLGDIPGTGLGLSLVQEIMQLQAGEAELHSQPGQGTQVTLWLPLLDTSLVD
jgi:signal transduction histidine kinase